MDPYRIMFFDRTFYFSRWCHLRKEVRMFVLDRIKTLSVTDETFEVPGDFELETYMRSPFRVIQDRPVKAKVRGDKKAAGYIKEKIWPHTQKIGPEKDGAILFSAGIAGTDQVKRWVLGWGKHAEILEPEFLRRKASRSWVTP